MIQVAKPLHITAELGAISRVLMSGWTGPGPEVDAFEKEFSEFLGGGFSVAVNSGTTALHMALLALGIGPGDKVLVPALTFISSVNAVLYCGATPIFVDVDPITLNARPVDYEHALAKQDKVKAMIVVHYGGFPAHLSILWDFAVDHNLLMVEDAAHACGAKYFGERIGSTQFSEAMTFSFDPIKNLTTGDGGMVVVHQKRIEEKLRRLRNLGIEKKTWDRMNGDEPGWKYSIEELGYRAHMNDIMAAMGRIQLKSLNERNQRRTEIANFYFGELRSERRWLRLPPRSTQGFQSSYFNFVVKTEHRDELYQFLRERKIGSGVHYIPANLQPFYKQFITQPLPLTEHVWKRLLTLPLHVQLTDKDVEQVIEAVKEFGNHGKNPKFGTKGTKIL